MDTFMNTPFFAFGRLNTYGLDCLWVNWLAMRVIYVSKFWLWGYQYGLKAVVRGSPVTPL